MIAYHGDAGLKRRTMAKVAKHRRLDQLVRGIGASGAGARFRGCAVGCTIGTYDHFKYPEVLGVPVQLAYLEDRIFESLQKAAAMKWPTQFLGAIKPGSDLSLVWPRFAVWLLTEELAKHAAITAPVAALYHCWIAGAKPADSEWVAARNEAWSKYPAAAAAAAAEASDAAAAAAAASVASAAAAAAAEASDAARKAYWLRASAKLIELLKAAPLAVTK